jgi:hypothetical protein
MATPFMFLNLPVPSVTLGPAWASQLNVALEVIDEHDHSNGKGTTVKTAGIEINADLNFNDYTLFGLKSVKLATQSVALSGATHAQSLFSLGGDLYFTSGAGSPVQITSGGAVVSVPGAVQTMPYSAVASSPYSATTVDVVMVVDTTAARTIILPAAATTSAGRIYVVKDGTGLSETNAITINPTGADTIDLQASASLESNFSSVFLISNGINNWTIL